MTLYMIPIMLYYFIFLFVLLPYEAHAYLDPGSGSMIIQIIIATVLGAVFAMRTMIKRILAPVIKFFKKPRDKKQ